MLPLIWIVCLAVGIALLYIGSAANGEVAFASGFVTIIASAVCIIVWLALYSESCTTVADLKVFAEAHYNNYEIIIDQSKEAIDWSKVSDSEWYVQDAMIGKYALILSEFAEGLYDYNQELGRLRDFNGNLWLDLIFRDVPPDLEYFKLPPLPALPEAEG